MSTQQFELLKKSAVTQIQADLEAGVESDRILAQQAKTLAEAARDTAADHAQVVYDGNKDLGTFADAAAIAAAHPSPDAGSWARNVDTGTIWLYSGSWSDTTVVFESSSADFREFNQIVDPVEAPNAPAVGKARMYVKDDEVRIITPDGAIRTLMQVAGPAVIRRNVNEASTKWEVVGGMNMFAAIKDQMQAATFNADLTVNYYLSKESPLLKADGVTAANVDGTDGDVGIIFPDLYGRVYRVGNYDYVAFSLFPFAGAELWPADVRGKYPGWVDGDGKLRSISGVTRTTNLHIVEFQAAAQLRHADAHIKPYWVNMKEILLALFQTLDNNFQSKVGYVSRAGSTDWSNYNRSNPVIDTGHFDDQETLFFGNKAFTIADWPTAPLNSELVSLFGIEDYYGHIWEFENGLNIDYATGNVWFKKSHPFTPDTAADHLLLNDSLPASGYISKMVAGHIIPELTAGGSNTYYCDYHYSGSSGWRVSRRGGDLRYSTSSGPFCSSFYHSSGLRYSYIGARLWFAFKG